MLHCSALLLGSSIVSTTLHCQQTLVANGRSAETRVAVSIGPKPGDSWFFGRVRDITVDGAGRTYVLDDSDQTIRVFDLTGKLLRVLGRRGAGPGEFLRARALQIVNDTLWVTDNNNARLSAFSTKTGEFLHSRRAVVYDQFTVSVSETGVFIVTPDNFVDATASKPATLRIKHETAGSRVRRQIGLLTITRPPLNYRIYGGEAKQPMGLATVPQPLDNGWISRASPDGKSIVLLDRDFGPTARTPTPFGASSPLLSIRLLEIGWSGDTIGDQTFAVPSRRVSSSDIALIVDSLARPNVGRLSSKPIGISKDIRDSLFIPTLWPAVTELIIGVDGSKLFRQPYPPAKIAKFWRVTGDGKQALPLEVASNFRIIKASLNRLWGISEDSDGMQSVQVLDVIPSIRPIPLR